MLKVVMKRLLHICHVGHRAGELQLVCDQSINPWKKINIKVTKLQLGSQLQKKSYKNGYQLGKNHL